MTGGPPVIDNAGTATCLFCRIVAGTAPADVLYRDDLFLVIRDIKPATTHHYLVLPREHMADAKHLAREDAVVIKRMEEIATAVLKAQGADLADSRMGFHWPPFQSIKHLHMHVLSPVEDMGYFNKKVAFRPDSWAFVTSEWLVSQLAGKQQS
eukprot:TRINITY_DN1797_c0_g1_i1.p1 TRINITY_DN1797_c0_g1~~TRINITY_DN1797_c0_g1_i1.p1  ORF type:complete len:153 (-),score=45.06 TRINITY_DN1797_c0_g1_i1:100-558(-)